MGATAAEELEYLDLLEANYKQRAIDNLDDYCRYIEIPGAPMVEDSCEKGDYCDDPKCDKHEISNAFYPQTIEPAKHHSIINSVLEKVESGAICPDTGNHYKRVMFFMPPGSAKSTYASVTFPTWYMGKNPNKNVISTSYGSTLSRKFGRKCRTITSSKEYNQLFNTSLRHDNRAIDDWSLTNGATYMCGGILSGITGNRADGLVIDDPVKGREDADSPKMREKTWEAYLNDLRTRLKPNGWITIVQTRWHEDDLSGRILPADWNGESGWVEGRDGENWYVVCLQAQCERNDDPLGRAIGDWLWTEWFAVAHWEQEKRAQGSRNWDALYMQRPKPAEGSVIKRAWVQRYNAPPTEFLRVIFSLDTAYKANQHNDPSVLAVWGQLENRHYLLDVWRDKLEYPELRQLIADWYMKWRPDGVLIEDKASGQSLIQEFKRGVILESYPKKIYIPAVAIEPEGDKLSRMVSESVAFEAQQIYLPEYAPWLIDYESELFGFPIATHDDQVDATSQYLKWVKTRGGLISHESTRRSITEQVQHAQKHNLGISRKNNSRYGGF